MPSIVSTKKIHIVQASIVLAGKGISPSAYSQIQLHKAGLISDQILDNWIFSSQIVQVHQTPLSLLVLPNQMTFGLNPSQSSSPDIATLKKVVDIQGESNFTGCGINFTWHIHFENSNAKQSMLETLGLTSPGFSKLFPGRDDGIGVVGSKSWNKGKLNLDVRSAGKNNDYLNLVFNYHANLNADGGVSPLNWLNNWTAARVESESLTKELGATQS